MQKCSIFAIALLGLALANAARSQAIPGTVNLRFSAQISNASAGTCGCFAMEGGAADASWSLMGSSAAHGVGLSLAADVGLDHTGTVNSSPYGLTLTTLTAGPRLWIPVPKLHIFGQALFGFAHGSNSQFPHNNSFVPSANSFALDLGGGADYALGKRFAVRVLQLDYLRTSLPNNSTDWQNNLRIGAGLTVRLAH
jgi:peptidoglycan-associated lipoprotein